MTTTLRNEIAHRTSVLQDRAASLRSQADALPELLAHAYRRRAAELELEAWAIEQRAAGLVDAA